MLFTKKWISKPSLTFTWPHYCYTVTVYKVKALRFYYLNLDCESFVSGAVILSPSETAQVCVGDDLEFTCSIMGRLLEWSFPLIMDSFRPFTHGITASGSAEAQTLRVVDNSTTYILTRSSSENSPVSSRLQISTVTDNHNGTTVTCMDVNSETESSTTIVTTDDQAQGICMRLYFKKSPVRFACLNNMFLLRIDWMMDLLSQGRLRLVFISELGIVCFIIVIKIRCQESHICSMLSDSIEFQSKHCIRLQAVIQSAWSYLQTRRPLQGCMRVWFLPVKVKFVSTPLWSEFPRSGIVSWIGVPGLNLPE